MNTVLIAADAALDRATDEVLTNSGPHWMKFCASIEEHEDFNDFPAAAPDAGFGNGAPAGPDPAGASSEAA